jgi:hypothetical protein
MLCTIIYLRVPGQVKQNFVESVQIQERIRIPLFAVIGTDPDPDANL